MQKQSYRCSFKFDKVWSTARNSNENLQAKLFNYNFELTFT